MSEIADRFAEEVEKLKQARDELRVQLDLGKKEASDAWEAAEEKWEALESRLSAVKRESADALEDVGEAAELLVDEVRDALSRLRKVL